MSQTRLLGMVCRVPENTHSRHLSPDTHLYKAVSLSFSLHTHTQTHIVTILYCILVKMLSNMKCGSTSIILIEPINCSDLHIPTVETGGTPMTNLLFQSKHSVSPTALPFPIPLTGE